MEINEHFETFVTQSGNKRGGFAITSYNLILLNITLKQLITFNA
ncbi:MAG: hypothetical protein ACD_79C00502G0002 [uncultured bacterium]|nr:MAG: hypothetical protein ACD_79C00502G0002 [uncultured bacterium]